MRHQTIEESSIIEPELIKLEPIDDGYLQPELENENNANDDLWSCGTKSQKKPMKKNHSKKTMKVQKNNFRCANCKNNHRNYVELEMHIVKCFKPIQEHACFICQRSFDTGKKLQNHLDHHKVFKNYKNKKYPNPKKPLVIKRINDLRKTAEVDGPK